MMDIVWNLKKARQSKDTKVIKAFGEMLGIAVEEETGEKGGGKEEEKNLHNS